MTELPTSSRNEFNKALRGTVSSWGIEYLNTTTQQSQSQEDVGAHLDAVEAVGKAAELIQIGIENEANRVELYKMIPSSEIAEDDPYGRLKPQEMRLYNAVKLFCRDHGIPTIDWELQVTERLSPGRTVSKTLEKGISANLTNIQDKFGTNSNQ